MPTRIEVVQQEDNVSRNSMICKANDNKTDKNKPIKPNLRHSKRLYEESYLQLARSVDGNMKRDRFVGI